MFWSPICHDRGVQNGMAQIGDTAMLISGPHSLLPPQDPNITGQQRQLRNRRMWELVLHGMAGMYMCIHIYTYMCMIPISTSMRQ